MQKILVIEDERGILENVVDILIFEDFNVIAATDGQEGVRLAIEHLPDLILCDIRMPGLDGYGVIETLRRDCATASIPLIVMTAKPNAMDSQYMRMMNIAYCLMKPFAAEALIEVVQACMGGDER